MKISVTKALVVGVVAASLSGLGGCDRFRSPESRVKRAEAATVRLAGEPAGRVRT